jgi:hypothetical protein
MVIAARKDNGIRMTYHVQIRTVKLSGDLDLYLEKLRSRNITVTGITYIFHH